MSAGYTIGRYELAYFVMSTCAFDGVFGPRFLLRMYLYINIYMHKIRGREGRREKREEEGEKIGRINGSMMTTLWDVYLMLHTRDPCEHKYTFGKSYSCISVGR